MRRRRSTTGWLIAALALAALLGIPALASAIGISLQRAPAPPQAVLRGQGQEQISYDVSFATTPDRIVTSVTGPGGVTPLAESLDVSGQASPIVRTVPFAPSASAPVGRYTARVEFYSSAGLENTATTIFDVADQLGTLQLVKFEDSNGNGTRDNGEPGVPGWTFRLVNPQGNPSVATTGADGTVVIGNVPAGNWQVTEVPQPGWVAVTPETGTITVPAGGVGTFTAGNVRPAPISGTVFIDTNRNGRQDAGESGRAGVRLDLTGQRPGGIGVEATTVSGAGGDYVFTDRLPGTYRVTVRRPGGLTLTTPGFIGGIPVTSGVGSPDNDFGLISGPGPSTAGGPGPPAARPRRPDIAIAKNGPETARAGQRFTYTIVVRNRSRFIARNVQVADLLPLKLTLVAIPDGATIRNGVVTWLLGDMRAGAQRTLRMRVRVNPGAGGRIVNTATVTADGLPARRDRVVTRLVGEPPTPRTGGVTG